jgi:hypothetical protein
MNQAMHGPVDFSAIEISYNHVMFPPSTRRVIAFAVDMIAAAAATTTASPDAMTIEKNQMIKNMIDLVVVLATSPASRSNCRGFTLRKSYGEKNSCK